MPFAKLLASLSGRPAVEHIHDAAWMRNIKSVGSSDQNKFYKKWIEFQKDGMSPISAEIPWISFEAIDYLDQNLTPTMTAFEYGSGGSSVYLARRLKHLTSVEHNADWFAAVCTTMAERDLFNWSGHHIPAEEGPYGSSRRDEPADYTSDESAAINYRAYASSIDAFSDEAFDMVLVDGRARPSCLVHAMPKVKLGGLLVLDNADRSYYTSTIAEKIAERFQAELDRVGPAPFIPDFIKTTIWRRVH